MPPFPPLRANDTAVSVDGWPVTNPPSFFSSVEHSAVSRVSRPAWGLLRGRLAISVWWDLDGAHGCRHHAQCLFFYLADIVFLLRPPCQPPPQALPSARLHTSGAAHWTTPSPFDRTYPCSYLCFFFRHRIVQYSHALRRGHQSYRRVTGVEIALVCCRFSDIPSLERRAFIIPRPVAIFIANLGRCVRHR